MHSFSQFLAFLVVALSELAGAAPARTPETGAPSCLSLTRCSVLTAGVLLSTKSALVGIQQRSRTTDPMTPPLSESIDDRGGPMNHACLRSRVFPAGRGLSATDFDGDIVTVPLKEQSLSPMQLLDSCSKVKVDEGVVETVMAMSLEELQEYALRGNDEAKTVMDTYYSLMCQGKEDDRVHWSAENGVQRLQLGDGHRCQFPPAKSAVVITGRVETETSDSYRVENKYSWCYCGDEEEGVYPKYPPTIFEGGDPSPGNLKIAVFADYSYTTINGVEDVSNLLHEASKIFQKDFGFGFGIISCLNRVETKVFMDNDGSLLQEDSISKKFEFDDVKEQISRYFYRETLDMSEYGSIMILTRRPLKAIAVGLAVLGPACYQGFSLVYTGISDGETTNVVAHEIGHSLGAHHDPARCGSTHVMSEKGLGDAIRTFSECSRDDIEANMRRRIHKGCVTDGTTSLGDLAGVFV